MLVDLEKLVVNAVPAMLLIAYAFIAMGSWRLMRKLRSAASRRFFWSIASLPIVFLAVISIDTILSVLVHTDAERMNLYILGNYIAAGVCLIWLTWCALAFFLAVRSIE